MAESRFVTDRRRRQEEYRSSRPDIKPPRTRSVLSEDERLSGIMDLPEAQAPPRGAVLALRPNPLELLPTIPGGPGMGPRGISPNPTKEADRAAVASAAAAAVLAEDAREDPAYQGSNAKLAPPPGGPTHVAGGVGTGPGAVAEKPPAAGRTPGPGRTQVKMPDGRFVFVTPDRGADYVAGGGSYASYQDATSGLGKPQAERFMRDRTSRTTSRSEGQPYSEQVRALGAEGPDLSFEGDTGFGISPPGSGGPAEGYRRLSGIEQAMARRTWLEGRADTEQARETERAELDRRTRLAEMDPLEMARIQAQGRMGGDLAKVQLDLRARQAAVEEHRRMSGQIEQAQGALAAAGPGSEEAMQLQQYIDYLVQTRRELSNLILGERLSDPRAAGDAFGAALAGLGMAAGGASTSGAAR